MVSELLRHRLAASVISVVSVALLPDLRLSLDSVRRLVSVTLLPDLYLNPDSVRRLVSGLALLRLPLAALVSSTDSAGLAGLAALPPLVPLLLRRQALASHRRLVRCLFRRVDLEVSAPVQLLFRRVESA